MLALLAFTLTISPQTEYIDLSAIAARMARKNWIERGSCVSAPPFATVPRQILFCRTQRGHPYICYRFVLSSIMGYEMEACEEFNEI